MRRILATAAAAVEWNPRRPDHLAAIAQLRVRHPQAGLTALRRIAIPPLSKDTVAGRLRRLIAMADRHTPRPRAAETS